MRWEIDVPIFRNTTILKQLGLAIGIPFGLLSLWLLVMALKGDRGAYYGLVIVGVVLLTTYLMVQLLYGGMHRVTFRLDEQGVFEDTRQSQQKKSRWVNGLAFLLGLFTRKAEVAGAGLLAAAIQKRYLPWKDVRHIKINQRQQTILLLGPPTGSIALFCSEDNFEEVRAFVDLHAKK